MDAGQVLNIEKNTRLLYIAREHYTTCIAAYCLNAVSMVHVAFDVPLRFYPFFFCRDNSKMRMKFVN